MCRNHVLRSRHLLCVRVNSSPSPPVLWSRWQLRHDCVTSSVTVPWPPAASLSHSALALSASLTVFFPAVATSSIMLTGSSVLKRRRKRWTKKRANDGMKSRSRIIMGNGKKCRQWKWKAIPPQYGNHEGTIKTNCFTCVPDGCV